MAGVASVNGIELYYEQHGEGHPFVLIHGWSGSTQEWTGVIPDLSQGRRVITYDQRGHGRSSNTGDASTYTFEHLVADFTALVDSLGLESFDLLGHSMGGLVAMKYALANPAKVRSLIPLDTGAAATPEGGALMQPLIDLVASDGMGAYSELAAAYLFPGEGDGHARAEFKRALDQVDPVAFVTLGKELTTYPSFLEDLGALSMPTTVIVGESDFNLRCSADDLARVIPGAELVVIPDAIHSPHLENTAAWLKVIESHFARVGS